MTQTTSPVPPVGGAPTPAARVQDTATRAATQVAGVHALGSPGGRALVRALGRVPGGRPTYGSGVSVEVGPGAVALDVSLVLEYGAQAVDVANRVRAAVDASVAQETGLDVVEVNVTVADVHHPSDDVEPEPLPEPVDVDDTESTEQEKADLEKADPSSWSAAEQPEPEQPETEQPETEQSETEQSGTDAPHTVVVLESGDATSGSDGPQVVTADEVVIADRVVVVGETSTDRTAS